MATYKSAYSGPQIDEAIGKALDMGGFVATIHEGTAPAAGNAYRETVFSSNKEAYLVECQYLNANGSWYGFDNETCSLLPKLQDGSICELRFRLASGDNAAAGRPIRALILAR